MDKETTETFYAAAKMFFGPDRDKIDALLETYGLSASEDSVDDCRTCILSWLPWPILTIQEAAMRYGLPARTIQAAAARGEFGGKRGNQWMISVTGLEHWLENRPKRGPKPSGG